MGQTALSQHAEMDAAELGGMSIHQKHLMGRPQLEAAADRALGAWRYPEDVIPEQADEFIRLVSERPAAGIMWIFEAISEGTDPEGLALLRLINERDHLAAGQLLDRIARRYALEYLERRGIEVAA